MGRFLNGVPGRLVVLVCATLVPMVLAVVAMIAHDYVEHRHAVEDRALSAASEASRRLEGYLSSVDLSLRTGALLAMRAVEHGASDPSGERRVFDSLRTAPPGYLEAIAVYDATGRRLLASDDDAPPRLDDSVVRELDERREQPVFRIRTGPPGAPSITVARLVPDPGSGRPLIAVATIDERRLAALLRDETLDSETLFAALDEDGTVLARYPALGGTDAEPRALARAVPAPPAQRMVFRTRTGDDVERLSASARLTHPAWTVMVGIPRAAAFAPVWSVFAVVTPAVLLLVVAVGAFAWRLSRRILGPMQQLAADADRLAVDLGHRAAVGGPPEIAAIALALNRATDAATAHEAALTKERNMLRALIDHMPDHVYAKDTEGRYILANRACVQARAYSCEADLLGRTTHQLIRADIADIYVAEDRQIVETGTPIVDAEEPFEWADGRTGIFRTTKVPLRDGGGALIGVVGVSRDVTQQKQHDRHLAQAQKMEAVGQLTGGMAHDFNNLLTVIVGNLDILSESGVTAGKQAQLVEGARATALRGAELTRQLLMFSRREVLQSRPVSLNALISDITHLLERTLGETVSVHLVLAEDLWPAMADPAQMEAAIINLAINARDALPEGGRLTIETANRHLDDDYAAAETGVTAGDYAMVAVSDDGTGIPADVLERVFEPFFTTKPPSRGSGLGLSIIYGFAKQSGGHVKIYSEVGMGTTVRLYLPRADGLPPENRARTRSEPADSGEGRILVVEDNQDVQRTVVSQLEALGYTVTAVEDGTAALAILESAAPVDLLFSDMVLPGGLSGAEIAVRARALRPGLPVLLTSGFADLHQNGDAPAPTDPILRKPYRRAELAAAIRTALGAS